MTRHTHGRRVAAAMSLLAVLAVGCGNTADTSAADESDTSSIDQSETPTDAPEDRDDTPSDEADEAPPENRPVTPSELEVGMCLVAPAGDVIAGLNAIACDLEHDLEILAVVDVDTGGDYPSREALEEATYTVCTGPTFEAYVGRPYDSSEIYVEAMTPTPESWVGGNRNAVCALYVPDGRLTGSVQGSGR